MWYLVFVTFVSTDFQLFDSFPNSGGQIQIAVGFKSDLNRKLRFDSKGLRFDLQL
jgi:hypothetical protein